MNTFNAKPLAHSGCTNDMSVAAEALSDDNKPDADRPSGPVAVSLDDDLSLSLATATSMHTATIMDTPKSRESIPAAAYDPAAEETEYGRALMTPIELERLKVDIAEHGFMTIDQVRELIQHNTIKEAEEAGRLAIDPEIMLQIDTRTNFWTFINGDSIYTREELFEHFPFEAFHVTPENVFVQQEIGVFSPKKWAPDRDDRGDSVYEYVARDHGGNSEDFIMIEDLVGQAAQQNYKMRRTPIKIVKTKIFLGKDTWDDFQMMGRFAKSFKRFVSPLMIGDMKMEALTHLYGRTGSLAVLDEASLTLEQNRADQARQHTLMQALETKAKTLQKKETELHQREEALFRTLGLNPPK